MVLSDIIGDPLDMIASGPAYPDSSTCDDAQRIVRKCGLKLSAAAEVCLHRETPKELADVKTAVTGSVSCLCEAAKNACVGLGYETTILTDRLSCEAKAAGMWLSQIARENAGRGRKLAFIAGGETVVKLTGKGKGGRNQELALSAAGGIAGLSNVAIFSVGSDGTDGPTDAAGGYVDGTTVDALVKQGIVAQGPIFITPYKSIKSR